MKVEKSEFEEWEKLRDHGDVTTISERSGINRVTLSNAFNSNECTEQVYTAIKTFYEEKKIRLQKLTA